jgi:hypothetical protein
MAWVRIHDNAMTHPKIIGLSDGAFRAWVGGLSYAQIHLTDGLLPKVCLTLSMARRAPELVAAGLWKPVEGGYQIHDFLQWNDARRVVLQKREDAKGRARRSRTSHSARAPHVLSGVVLSVQEDQKVLKKEEKVAPRPQRFGRIDLHRWQLESLIASLGPHAATFDLDAWVLDLSRKADASGLVLEKRTLWPWVQAKFREEVAARGLSVASADSPDRFGKQTSRLLQAVASLEG